MPQGSLDEVFLEQSPIIFVTLKHESDGLEIFVNKSWLQLVHPDQHEYISDLVQDFEEQATREPDTLFRHLNELQVGVLVADAVESVRRDSPELLDLLRDFDKI